MIRWTCNFCISTNQHDIGYFHRELGACEKCGSNVRFRAILYLLEKYVVHGNKDQLAKIRGIGLSDADLYANRLSVLVQYKNTFFHKAPFLDITDPISASQYQNLDFVICSDVLEHVDVPVESAFANLAAMLKSGGALILSVPYFTDAVSAHTIEHFVQHKSNKTVVEDGREYLVTDTGAVYANLCWHGGPGSVLERRVFAETALRKCLSDSGFAIEEICGDIPQAGIIYNMVGSKVMMCRKQ